LHRIVGLVEIAVFHPHLQQHVAARVQGVGLFLAHQPGRNQRKQVGRLLERVFPLGIVAAIAQVALFDQVAVRQQYRVSRLVGAQHHGVPGHHVRTVGEIRDAAEAFGFALGEEVAVRHIQAGQGGVFHRRAQGFDFQHHVLGRIFDREQHAVDLVLARFQQLAVQPQLHQFNFLAVQDDIAVRACRVALHGNAVGNNGAVGVQVEAQFNRIDQEGGRGVIFAVNRQLAAIGAHGIVLDVRRKSILPIPAPRRRLIFLKAGRKLLISTLP